MYSNLISHSEDQENFTFFLIISNRSAVLSENFGENSRGKKSHTQEKFYGASTSWYSKLDSLLDFASLRS